MTEPKSKPVSLLAAPGYLTALALVVFPVLDLGLTVYPPNFGGVAWRFAAIGLFSGGLVTPLLGLALAVFIAVTLEQRTMALVVGVLCALLALASIPSMPIFALDSLQMTTQVQPDMQRRFMATWVFALLKLLILAASSVALAVAAFRASGRMSAAHVAPSRSRADERLVAKPRVERGASERAALPGPLGEAVDVIENDLRAKSGPQPSISARRS